MAIFEILMDNFQLAFELDLRTSSVPLGRGCGVTASGVRVMREGECAAEEHKTGENGSAEDPRGTDLDLHGGTFLTAMIATGMEQSEIPQVQSQKDISEVQEPLGVSKRGVWDSRYVQLLRLNRTVSLRTQEVA